MPHQVPWLVEQALHPAEVGRQLAYAAFQGQEGVSDALSCRVVPQDIPGPYIKVLPGSYAILNRSPGYPNQMYTGRIIQEDVVPVQNTTSSGGRTDLVVARVKNPDTEGVAPPQNRDNGPYAVSEVIRNVPAGIEKVEDLNLGYSAIALARLSIPASTGAIQGSMITDLRGTKQTPVPAPATFTDVLNYSSASTLPPPPNGSGTRYLPWTAWPAGATWQVPVPTWATDVQLYYQVTASLSDNTWGEMRVNFNGRYTQTVAFDCNYPLISGAQLIRCVYTNGGGMRELYVAAGRVAVTSAERGTTVPVRIEARTIDHTVYQARGTSLADRGSVGFFTANFKQAAASA